MSISRPVSPLPLTILVIAFFPIVAHGTEPSTTRASIEEQTELDTETESGEPKEEQEQPEQSEEFSFVEGPKDLSLGHNLSLELPEGYAYLPPEEARQALEQLGSFDNESVLGLVVSEDEEEEYIVVIDYNPVGYIDDDEELDADAILKSLQDRQVEANVVRQEHGFTALTIDGWAEIPRYEAQRNHLVWAAIVSDKEGSSINFNTRILGRRGYVSLNLVTSPEDLTRHKPAAETLLRATTFDVGSRHEDFNPDTDDKAGFGIAALVAGGAAATKVGFFAKFGKLLLALLFALKKGAILVVIGIGIALKKLFGGGKKDLYAPSVDEVDRDSESSSV